MPATPVDVGDAIELAELLQFLGGWLESDHDILAASWPGSSAARSTVQARCVTTSPGSGSLLGVTDGEGLFTPDEA